jgi:SAM-dependent methyltransferase
MTYKAEKIPIAFLEPARFPLTSRRAFTDLITKLYKDQLRIKNDEFLYLQSRTEVGIGRRIDAFLKYQDYLKSGAILDWGCKHSLDGCLIKYVMGDRVQMHGCDVGENNFEAFHDYAGTKFTELTHPYLLPYEDNQFDVVVGSAVLEHVPNDSESLKEVYRILKPGGLLIITFLPNHLSYTEAIVSAMNGPAHKRRYRASEIKSDLLHHGFHPLAIGYHQVTPSMSSLGSKGMGEFAIVKLLISFLYSFNHVLEKMWPLKKIATNLFVVAQKVDSL